MMLPQYVLVGCITRCLQNQSAAKERIKRIQPLFILLPVIYTQNSYLTILCVSKS